MAEEIDVSGLFSLDSKKLIEAHEMVASTVESLETMLTTMLTATNTLLAEMVTKLDEIKEGIDSLGD
jgi:uncharacterized protein Yka (UPF0111/DUF47 family)